VGARRQQQQHSAQRDECHTEQVVQVHAMAASHGHREEDRVETRRVESDDDRSARNGENSEHAPQGSQSTRRNRARQVAAPGRAGSPAFGRACSCADPWARGPAHRVS